MGIKGAALGTGIGYLIPTVAGLLFFTAGNGSMHFRRPVMDISILAGSCTNGFSDFLFCGMNIFTSATFTALSNGKLSAVLSFLRTFGLIFVLLLILPQFMGVTGVWLAVPIAELLTMVVALAFLYQNKDRYHYA
jgi:Na+-driven multidrug efflux pump